ncbi:uncharacterized protein EKO05_0009960 [Ascochyta rabiei]|uniref:Uncharacterized protein n=1 Tax=Didymella rabiei TaxID=5454 RepID=A0A162WRK7_DIDRA|nr:uncharacterized protein EKO05_0009960 [Ascochyta rabiei]KZM19177.1 hypothetical protein ST47_g9680 [Ascochyta rabiei]UPX19706.1 hypothetical protein EKO05_0009960 [Ascochyta rabiei]
MAALRWQQMSPHDGTRLPSSSFHLVPKHTKPPTGDDIPPSQGQANHSLRYPTQRPWRPLVKAESSHATTERVAPLGALAALLPSPSFPFSLNLLYPYCAVNTTAIFTDPLFRAPSSWNVPPLPNHSTAALLAVPLMPGYALLPVSF